MSDEPGEAGTPSPALKNTDHELWRERDGDYYADSIHVTDYGSIGINCGGSVIVAPLRTWHKALSGAPSVPMAGVAALVKKLVAEEVAGRGVPDARVPPIRWSACACGAEHDTPTCPFGAAVPDARVCPECQHAWHDDACPVETSPSEIRAFPHTCACIAHEDRPKGAIPDAPLEPPPDRLDRHLIAAVLKEFVIIERAIQEGQPAQNGDIDIDRIEIEIAKLQAAVPAALLAVLGPGTDTEP